MSKETRRKISQFAAGKKWFVIEARLDYYIISIGGRIWCVNKCRHDD